MPELGIQYVKKTSTRYLGLWLLIPFSNFAIHKGVPLPPALIMFLFGSMILFYSQNRAKAKSGIGIPLFIAAYFLVTQPLVGAPFSRYMSAFFAISYFVVIVLFIGKLHKDQINQLSDQFIKVAVALLVLESIWRITHPNLDYLKFADGDDARWIYMYKYASFMYADSNGTAIHIVVILFYILYLEEVHTQKWRKSKLILVVLLLLTFSRAAWLGAVLGWIYVRFLQQKKFSFYLLNFTALVFLASLVYIFYLREKIETDLSFQSKFEIVEIVLSHFKNATLVEWLLGIGFSNSLTVLDIYAHNFEMVFLIESGVIGFLLMALCFTNFIYITHRKALFIIVPFLITTLSSTIIFMPFFYVAIAMIYVKQRGKTIILKQELSPTFAPR
jgi:hypothetical protein